MERVSATFTGAPTGHVFELRVAERLQALKCKVFAPVGAGFVYGIYLEPTSPTVDQLVEGCRIEGMPRGIRATAGNAVVRGNKITGAAEYGIVVYEDDVLVDRNKILLANPGAIGIYTGNLVDSVVRRNKVIGAGTGIEMHTSDGNTIRANKLKSLTTGVRLLPGSDNNQIGPGNVFVGISGTNVSDSGTGNVFIP